MMLDSAFPTQRERANAYARADLTRRLVSAVTLESPPLLGVTLTTRWFESIVRRLAGVLLEFGFSLYFDGARLNLEFPDSRPPIHWRVEIHKDHVALDAIASATSGEADAHRRFVVRLAEHLAATIFADRPIKKAVQ